MRCLGGFFLCFLVSSALLANEVCTRIPGSTICTAGELDVLTETGIVHIHSTKIKHCHITGELLVKHAEIDVLEVIGKANVISSNINTGKVLGLLSPEADKKSAVAYLPCTPNNSFGATAGSAFFLAAFFFANVRVCPNAPTERADLFAIVLANIVEIEIE